MKSCRQNADFDQTIETLRTHVGKSNHFSFMRDFHEREDHLH